MLAFAYYVLLLLSIVVAMGWPVYAVTTPQDVSDALDRVARHSPPAESSASLDAELAEKLRELRTRARDFAIGSVIEASRGAQERTRLLARASQRVRRAGIPMTARPQWQPEQFTASVGIEYFPLQEDPGWFGARVVVGIPCGEDISLFLWQVQTDRESDSLEPQLLLARESPLTDLSSSTGKLSIATARAEDNALELATVETGVWCNSQWRKASMNVLRSTDHAYRPARLFHYQELAFLGGEPQPRVERRDRGYHFEYLTHYWLNPSQHSRLRELEVRIEGNRAEMLIPRSEDPALFFDQWLATPWDASRSWTTGLHLSALRNWHETHSPVASARLTTELGGGGGCRHDPLTVWVRLHTEAQPGVSSELFGILRRLPDGFRVDRITEELPEGCPAASANGTGAPN